MDKPRETGCAHSRGLSSPALFSKLSTTQRYRTYVLLMGMLSPVRLALDEPCFLPVAAEAVAAGFPSPAEDYVTSEINLSEELICHPAATFLVRVAGDSMLDAGISDGDELIVDRSLTPQDGDVVVAVVDGEFTVKTFRSGPAPVLLPANPDFPPITLIDCTDAQIWGVATTCLHHLRHRPNR